MATQRPLYTGVENCMAAWKANNKNSPYFSVWYNDNRQKSFEWNEDDIEEAEEFLQNNLNAFEQSGNTSILTIRIHPTQAKVYNKDSDVTAQLPIRACPISDGITQINGLERNPGQGMNYEMYEAMKAVKDLPVLLADKFKTLDERLTAIEDDEPEEDRSLVGQITGILENDKIMGAIIGIVQMFKTGQVPPTMPQHQIAGVKENDTPADQERQVDGNKLQDAINRLHPYCEVDNDLALLADLAEKNKPVFEMMLKQLRSL